MMFLGSNRLLLLATTVVAFCSTAPTNAQQQRVTDFVLVNTDTGKDVLVLTDGIVLDTAVVGSKLTVRAETTTTPMFVKFDLDGGKTRRVEQSPPYSLAGTSSTTSEKKNGKQHVVFYPSNLLVRPGPHTLTASPNPNGSLNQDPSNAQENARRTMQDKNSASSSSSYTVTFTVVHGSGKDDEDSDVVTEFGVFGLTGDSVGSDSTTATNFDVPGHPVDPYGALSGDMVPGGKITLAFAGPLSSQTGMTEPGMYRAPSTFADYRMDVTFTLLDDDPNNVLEMHVPGYFAATSDSHTTGAIAGNVWQCHFVAPQAGQYKWTAHLKQGTNAAQNGGGDSAGFFDSAVGSFFVEEPSASSANGDNASADDAVEYKGRLVATGGQLKYERTGERFVAVGAATSLNVLDWESSTFSGYESYHIDGNPTFLMGNGTGVIGSLRYLGLKGVNTVTSSPFGPTTTPFVNGDPLNYNVSKLARWAIIVDWAREQNVVVHFQLEHLDMAELDNGGDLLEERKLFYREMVARFGHGSVVWSLGEDSSTKRIDYLRSIDTYNSPIVVSVGSRDELPNDVSADGVVLTTTNNSDIHDDTNAAVTKKLFVWSVASAGGNVKTLWGNLMAGGSGVLYDKSESEEMLWAQSRHAATFFQSIVGPLAPNPDVCTGDAWCLTSANVETIVIYKKEGIELTAPVLNTSKEYTLQLLDPLTGVMAEDPEPVGDPSLYTSPSETDRVLLLACSNCEDAGN